MNYTKVDFNKSNGTATITLPEVHVEKITEFSLIHIFGLLDNSLIQSILIDIMKDCILELEQTPNCYIAKSNYVHANAHDLSFIDRSYASKSELEEANASINTFLIKIQEKFDTRYIAQNDFITNNFVEQLNNLDY